MGQSASKYKIKRSNLVPVFVSLFFVMMLSPAHARVNSENDSLWLSLAPAPSATGPACDMHGAPASVPPQAKAASQKPRWGKKASGKKGKGSPRAKSDFESEHRPTPERTYFLSGSILSPSARAYLLHPDGSHAELDLIFGPQSKVSFKMPMREDHRHGPNNVYVVDKEVKNGELIVRTAKWITIHHSCGWGHDYRNDSDRLKARTLAEIPFDIVIDDLWDGNFHVRTSSGDQLRVKTLAFGTPIQGSKITTTTEKKWQNTETTGKDGIADIQLIRDYYPAGWNTFKRTKLGHLNLKAEYQLDQSGVYQGQPYTKVRYITTLPWRYTPAFTDYASYAYGLGLGFAAFLVSGFGIYYFRERRKKPYQGINFDE